MKLREGGLRPGGTLRVTEAGMIEVEPDRKAEKRARKEAKRSLKESMHIARDLGITSEEGQRAFAEWRPELRRF